MKKYLCGVDYQHEMDEGLADFYDSVGELQCAKRCWKQCGIVAIQMDSQGKITHTDWIYPQDFRGEDGSES